MTQVVLPRLNQTGANEWSDVQSNDEALQKVVNGELESDNIKNGTIDDTDLVSPNNATYRLLGQGFSVMSLELAAGTYILMTATRNNNGIAVNKERIINESVLAFAPAAISLNKADYEVGGKTQKLRLRAQVMSNATKATIKYTFGLYPLTLEGSGVELKAVLGTVVAGSTVEISEPAASTITGAAGADFSIPADGAYCLGFVTSAKLNANQSSFLQAQLQTRNT
jgi:hypothetical protein